MKYCMNILSVLIFFIFVYCACCYSAETENKLQTYLAAVERNNLLIQAKEQEIQNASNAIADREQEKSALMALVRLFVCLLYFANPNLFYVFLFAIFCIFCIKLLSYCCYVCL